MDKVFKIDKYLKDKVSKINNRFLAQDINLLNNKQQHPERTCNYLTSCWNKYKDIPFSKLVPIALYIIV